LLFLLVIPEGDLLLSLLLPLFFCRAVAVVFALIFRRHPERSEGSRRSPPNTNPSDFPTNTAPPLPLKLPLRFRLSSPKNLP
jgi:hypothetical protein